MPSRRHYANAIRALSMDAVQKANSGHPGAPMGMADIAEVRWRDYLKHNPANPQWPDRDRFVLSNGHASMLLYSLLHLTGYDLSLDDLKNFRQLHSRTAGHPEYGLTPGVETSTGPLGQGLANAVGFAAAEKILAAHFNRPDFPIVDHYTYVFLGDGCLMEGISHEVCSLAGTLGLNKLITFYDDNGISIDGHVEGWFRDDTSARFRAYGWQVVADVDGHDASAIAAAIEQARSSDRPTLICCKTTIGFGAPNKQGSESCHGAPLGAEEIAAARKQLDWSYGPFEIPADVYAAWDAKDAGDKREQQWQQLFADYRKAFPELAEEFSRRMAGELPQAFAANSEALLRKAIEKPQDLATRKASQNCLQALAPLLPELLGGSADLAGSNLTTWQGSKAVSKQDPDGNYLHYGVREFGMTAMVNGIALHGGFIPFSATFLVFMDYARNAVRMSAMMKLRVVHVYTHDSIGLGEDGPTHQPIEQLASLRMTPNLDTWRPCDAVESAVAWSYALQRREGPSALVFSRQKLPHVPRDESTQQVIARGGYVLRDCQGEPQLILIATGSEVALALAAHEQLSERGVKARVVSMPSTSVFDRQETAYRDAVLPPQVGVRIAIEAAHRDFWFKYVGLGGCIIGMDSFGESAPGDVLFKLFGFTVDHVMEQATALLGR